MERISLFQGSEKASKVNNTYTLAYMLLIFCKHSIDLLERKLSVICAFQCAGDLAQMMAHSGLCSLNLRPNMQQTGRGDVIMEQ